MGIRIINFYLRNSITHFNRVIGFHNLINTINKQIASIPKVNNRPNSAPKNAPKTKILCEDKKISMLESELLTRILT